MSEAFYRAFEDRHRGSRETIHARQAAYLPFLRALRSESEPRVLVDLGCGRGEWLALVRSEGWQVQGVDIDGSMLAAARESGLDVREGDAIEYLGGLADASADAVSAFHVAEHLPFERLQQLVREALRVLRPGGLLVLETPNPENLVVGSSAFHLDPTHVKPLPPPLLAFVVEFAGFARVSTLRLHEGLAGGAPVTLIDVLAGVSPDYAIVATKPGAQVSPALDALLASSPGVTLNELAERYDRQAAARAREVQIAADIARELSLALQSRVAALERSKSAWIEFEQHAADRAFALQQRLEAIEHSTSWRVTAPVRWAGAQRIELRKKGAKGFVRAVVMAPLHALDRLLHRVPRIRALLSRPARAIGLARFVVRPPDNSIPVPSQPQPLDRQTMSEHARRVHDGLRQLLDAAARKDH